MEFNNNFSLGSDNTDQQSTCFAQMQHSTAQYGTAIPPALLAEFTGWPHIVQQPTKNVKTELKRSIEHKRTAKGQEMPRIEWNTPSMPQPRAPEKHEDKIKRRLSNKHAATKCRQKKRHKLDTLKKISFEAEMKNKRLIKEVRDLREQVNQLRDSLRGHTCVLQDSNQSCSLMGEGSGKSWLDDSLRSLTEGVGQEASSTQHIPCSFDGLW